MEKVDIGKLIDEETEKRLDLMQSPEYVFPKQAGKSDAIAIVVSIIICAALIFGCMTGVIV